MLVYIVLAQSAHPSQLSKTHVSIITQRKPWGRAMSSTASITQPSTSTCQSYFFLLSQWACTPHLIIHWLCITPLRYALNSGIIPSSLKPSFINSKSPVSMFPPISLLSQRLTFHHFSVPHWHTVWMTRGLNKQTAQDTDASSKQASKPARQSSTEAQKHTSLLPVGFIRNSAP